MSVKQKHLMEVDLIKGIAIISVVLVHCLPYNDSFMTLRIFAFSMALLIFMLLMGRNMYASFEKHQYMENGFHTVSYLKNRLIRFLYHHYIHVSLSWDFTTRIFIWEFIPLVGYLPSQVSVL